MQTKLIGTGQQESEKHSAPMKLPMHTVSQPATGAMARKIIRAVASGRAITNARAQATFDEIAAGWRKKPSAKKAPARRHGKV